MYSTFRRQILLTSLSAVNLILVTHLKPAVHLINTQHSVYSWRMSDGAFRAVAYYINACK
jgi:hypothetical protein